MPDPTPAPRLRRNDYGSLPLPELGRWRPELTVTVVVPAHGGQDRLDLVLAALSAQTYPPELLEVVVVDDGSEPPLELRGPRPERTRLVDVPGRAWGIAEALHAGIAAADGSIIVRIDADVIADRTHVEAHARWHHLADYLTVMGTVRFVHVDGGEDDGDGDGDDLDPDRVRSAVAGDGPEALFDGHRVTDSWTAGLVERHDGLKSIESRAYTVANGAAVSFTRAMYERVGGVDRTMPLGSDTELGYRLAVHGAVFVPERAAMAWHLGSSTVMNRREESHRFRDPYFAGRVPLLRRLRNRPGPIRSVPLIDVLVEAGTASFEDVATTVDAALVGSPADAAVTLAGPWSTIREGRRALLDDPALDLRLLAETYAADPRVRLVERAAPTSAPAPFRLVAAAGTAIGAHALQELYALAEDRRAGLVTIDVDGGEPLRLERTAAFARALLVGTDTSIDELVEQLWGTERVDGGGWFAAPGGPEVATAADLAEEAERLRGRNTALAESHAKQERRAEHWKQNTANARARADKAESRAERLSDQAERYGAKLHDAEASVAEQERLAEHWKQNTADARERADRWRRTAERFEARADELGARVAELERESAGWELLAKRTTAERLRRRVRSLFGR